MARLDGQDGPDCVSRAGLTDPVDLIDQSAATALAHAAQLRARLNDLGRASVDDVDEARAEAHQLIVDIVSLRNAAELLKRELRRPGLSADG